MSHAEFVHLHNHTEYSLLDGATRLTDDKGNPSEFIKDMAVTKAAVGIRVARIAVYRLAQLSSKSTRVSVLSQIRWFSWGLSVSKKVFVIEGSSVYNAYSSK